MYHHTKKINYHKKKQKTYFFPYKENETRRKRTETIYKEKNPIRRTERGMKPIRTRNV